jgi:hypothetical protein
MLPGAAKRAHLMNWRHFTYIVGLSTHIGGLLSAISDTYRMLQKWRLSPVALPMVAD